MLFATRSRRASRSADRGRRIFASKAGRTGFAAFALACIVCLAFGQAVALGQEDTGGEPDDQLEQELAEVRADLIKAFNESDLELLLSYCHDDVIATWPHGRVAVGHDGVREAIAELLGGDQQIIESYRTDPVVETRVVLNDGQAVVSRGKFNDEYTLTRPKGKTVRLDSNWTATLVKIDGRWLIASFHMSTNAFDNEVIDLFAAMTRFFWGSVGGVSGLVIGLIVGIVLGRWRSRKKPEAA
jgi:uncharacterized protein (TIGR02246 family)